MAPYLYSSNSKMMHELAQESSQKYGGRFLVLNKSGIVQVDSFSILNGQKLEHREISEVLLGPDDTSYGFHEMVDEEGETFYAVYYTSAIVYQSETIGAVLFADDIQDVVDITREILSACLLLYLRCRSCCTYAVQPCVLRVYNKPINDLEKYSHINF